MKLSQKDKSLILFSFALFIILWAIFSIFSNLFFTAAFHVSDASKITSGKKTQWVNLSRELNESDLKDRLILVDFWTRSCVDCLQAIPEIKKLENEFGSKINVINIHSGKFDDEKDVSSLKKAVLKYDITGPVLQDVDFEISDKFKIKAWPTLLLINPRGNVVKKYEGLSDFSKIRNDLKKLISKFKYDISREPLPILLEKNDVLSNVLSFPTKLKYVENFSYKSQTLPVIIIANTGKNNIVISSLTGEIIVKIGSTKEGFENGSFDVALFRFPQGIAYKDKKLYVADSGNHSLRVVDFQTSMVSTLVGSGKRGDIIDNDILSNPENLNLSSPSDLEFFPSHNHLAIANSGTNQIITYDIENKTISLLAGDGSIEINDGESSDSSLAQTTDMSVYDDKLYFVDAKTSSLRFLDKDGKVTTLIGKGVYQFGHKNGDKSEALMQNPLGLSVDDTGAYISDSFNHVIRKYDFATNQLRDLIGDKKGDEVGSKTQFNEPDGIIPVIDRFYIADSNNNRILVVKRGNLSSEILDVLPPLKFQKEGLLEYLPNLEKSDGFKIKAESEINLKFNIKSGWKINSMGPSFVNLLEIVKDKNANLIANFDWNSIAKNDIVLPKLKSEKDYVLQGVVYYCEDKPNALCYVKSYDIKIDVSANYDDKEIGLSVGSSKK